jgi:hypothetical protein
MLKDFAEMVGYFVLAAVIFALIALLSAVPLMFLWNWLMPSIFKLQTIGLLEAIGLSLMSSILFKSSISKSSK